jgi:hypothetical protein
VGSKRDLILLADGIAKLTEELIGATASEDRTEIAALLDLARETYTIVKARVENPTVRGRSNRRPHHAICSSLVTPR